MAIRNVARLGSPVLRQRAREISVDEINSPEIQRLIDDLFETMHEYDGIGLAAPQVHESVRLLITADLHDPDDLDQLLAPSRVLINPEIVFLTQEETVHWEGCLSVPDLRGRVSRPDKIQVTAYDREGKQIKFEAEGFPATVIQHEYDHLEGTVFLDRMPDLKSLSFLREFERYVAGATDEDE